MRTGIRVGAGVAATSLILGTLYSFLGLEPKVLLSRVPRSAVHEVAATREIRYQVVPVERKSGWGVARGIRPTMHQLREELLDHRGGGYRVEVGGEWGETHNLVRTLHRFQRALTSRPVFGEGAPPVEAVVVVKAMKDSYRERGRRIDRNPAKFTSTEGTTAVDIIVGTTVWYFPAVQVDGIYACRTISGSGTLSQHAYGNAVDFFGSTTLLDDVASFQYSLVKRGYLPISQLLWRGRDVISGHSVSNHYSHIHDSGDPLLSGGCSRPGMPATEAAYEAEEAA